MLFFPTWFTLSVCNMMQHKDVVTWGSSHLTISEGTNGGGTIIIIASLLKPNQPFCEWVPVLIPSTKMHLITPSLDFSHLQGLITAQPNDWEPWKASVIKKTFKPASNTWNFKEILYVCRGSSHAPLACSSLLWKWTHTGLSWRPCILF